MNNKLLEYSIFCSFIILFTAACESNLTDNSFNQNEFVESDDIETSSFSLTVDNSSNKFFGNFLEMLEKVGSMSNADLDSLDDHNILQLGLPIQKATASTIYLDEELLQEIFDALKILTRDYETIPDVKLYVLSAKINSLLKINDTNRNPYKQKPTGGKSAEDKKLFNSSDDIRSILADKIRSILKNWTADSEQDRSCEMLFNKINDHIFIRPGENLNISNYVCPENSIFVLNSGTYKNQSVTNSKSGNRWIGLGDVNLDGTNNTLRAFDGGLDKNTIALLTISNYYSHGIYSSSGATNINITRTAFHHIAPDSSGQDYGAIKLDNASDVAVKNSHFENVASAVRFRFSTGPLKVIENTALNIGRNFFQCDDCNGAGIRINRNSMERTGTYGIAVLEDWINILKSNGTRSDWIQVNYNRARGHSLSESGSFIILGDAGGSYQEAVGNIGVNPGQVGIGIAGGENIKVEANLMYSDPWDFSNVAYYSAFYTITSCGNHHFSREEDGDEPNRANWICGDKKNCPYPPQINIAWTDGRCGINLDQIRTNVKFDRSLSPEIWNDWSYK